MMEPDPGSEFREKRGAGYPAPACPETPLPAAGMPAAGMPAAGMPAAGMPESGVGCNVDHKWCHVAKLMYNLEYLFDR
jgi:hypothetical protein